MIIYRPVGTLGRTGWSTAVRVPGKTFTLGWTFSPERGLRTLHVTLGDTTLEVSRELLTPSIAPASSCGVLGEITDQNQSGGGRCTWQF